VRSTPPAVRVTNLGVRFGARVALHDLGLEIPQGQFVALTGPNGSGKTTLIRSLLGFLVPDVGSVELFGTPVERLSFRERARQVAWVPQEEVLRDDVPLRQYVLYGRYPYLRPLDRETTADLALAQRVLAEVGLAERANDGILSISGGERQRAILARALAQETPLLLLDEPTSHLDIGHQLDLLSRVRTLSRHGSVTVLAALHDLNLAARYADRIVVLSRGRRVADGAPRDVLSEDLLARVWGVAAELAVDARSGLPYLLPRSLITETPPAPSSLSAGPVHVVGGGGAAAPLLRALTDAGYRVTAGALHLLDTDAETADSLGVVAAIEAPFAPLGPDVRARHRVLLGEARVIVVAPFAVGPSNLANLEDVIPFARTTPVILQAPAPGARLDFAGGAALRVRDALEAVGAVVAADVPTVVAAVARALTPAHAQAPASLAQG
jgi:iron complex transport system ATP-binding protein